jgi:hypothetical protein
VDAFEGHEPFGVSSPYCRRLQRINQSAPSARFRKTLSKQHIPRKAASTLVQLRTSPQRLSTRANAFRHTLLPTLNGPRGISLSSYPALPCAQPSTQKPKVSVPITNEAHSEVPVTRCKQKYLIELITDAGPFKVERAETLNSQASAVRDDGAAN